MTPERLISNLEFANVIFSSPQPGAFLWGTSFPGDPSPAGGAAWRGRPIKPGSPLALNEAGNTYFNISTVKEYLGEVTRQEGSFDALYVIVLDDVGTKGATLPNGVIPTYLIETSPGNFQAGFKLKVPCRDLNKAKALYKALIAKGLSDAGFGGPQSRYARLPVGVNHKGKCGPAGFPHRLAQWNPDRTFTIEEIVLIFGLELEIEAAAPRPPAALKRGSPGSGAAYVTDKTDEIIIGKVLRSAKARRVWDGENIGFDSGSAADQYLLNFIAFSTRSREQVDRIYSQSPRASRKSSDGTCKWLKRADYRKRSIETAIRFVDDHPDGDADEARATVEAAIAEAKVSADSRVIYATEVVDAFAVLKKGDAANYDHLRKQAGKAGVTLATLDAEVNIASAAQNLSHDDAAELAIVSLGGIGGLIFNRGQFWNWRQELGVWKVIDSDETIKKAIHGVLPKRQINAGTVGSILSVLRTKVARDDIEFDRPSDKDFINCLNGTLHRRDIDLNALNDHREEVWELRPHRREDYLTARVPVAWELGAVCPRFDQFLEDITLGDSDAEEKCRTLKELIGYTLMPSTREERFVILYGESSSNGKSTLLEIVRRVAGAENTSALSLQQLGERFGLAGLQSKLANICAEIQRSAVLPDDVIKKLTSGDTITVERKGRDHFEMRPTATLWFATNTLPNLRDLSPATLEKRCILIELNRSFKGEDRDTGLIDKLTEELPGILYQCVEWFGRMSILSREPCTWSSRSGRGPEATGWYGSLMADPPSSIRAKAAWRKDADPVQQFADDWLVEGSGHYVDTSELFAAWRAWTDANGVSLSLNSRQLTTRLGKIFPKAVTGDAARVGRKRGVRGLALAAMV